MQRSHSLIRNGRNIIKANSAQIAKVIAEKKSREAMPTANPILKMAGLAFDTLYILKNFESTNNMNAFTNSGAEK